MRPSIGYGKSLEVDTAAAAKSGDLKCVLMDVISKIRSMTKAGERL